jgi:hypothetical protein
VRIVPYKLCKTGFVLQNYISSVCSNLSYSWANPSLNTFLKKTNHKQSRDLTNISDPFCLQHVSVSNKSYTKPSNLNYVNFTVFISEYPNAFYNLFRQSMNFSGSSCTLDLAKGKGLGFTNFSISISISLVGYRLVLTVTNFLWLLVTC